MLELSYATCVYPDADVTTRRHNNNKLGEEKLASFRTIVFLRLFTLAFWLNKNPIQRHISLFNDSGLQAEAGCDNWCGCVGRSHIIDKCGTRGPSWSRAPLVSALAWIHLHNMRVSIHFLDWPKYRCVPRAVRNCQWKRKVTSASLFLTLSCRWPRAPGTGPASPGWSLSPAKLADSSSAPASTWNAATTASEEKTVENGGKNKDKRGVRGHHEDAFSQGCGPKSLTHLLLGKLSAQLAVFLQHVVHLGAVLANRPLPQIDVAFALHRDGGGHVFFIPVKLLRLSHLLNLKKIMCYSPVKICSFYAYFVKYISPKNATYSPVQLIYVFSSLWRVFWRIIVKKYST